MTRISENKNLLILVSGNILAQLIPLALSPVLSRLYSPHQFGELALLMNIANPLVVIACLRYDAAIVIPAEEKNARDLLRLSLRIALITSCISFVLAEGLIVLSDTASYFSKNALILRLVAPTVFFAAAVTAINYWLQRKTAFKAIAAFKLLQMCSIALISLGWCFVLAGNGLAWGYTIGWGLAAAAIAWYLLVKFPVGRKREDPGENYLRTYSRFPLYNGIPEFLSTVALSIPLFIFVHQFGEDEAGYLNLCRQVLYFPASFIATALAQYYYQEFSVHFRENKKLVPVLRKITLLTLPIALLMLVVVTLAGPWLFSFVFGHQWLHSGHYAQVLVVVFGIQLCAIPLQTMFSATGKNHMFGLFKTLSFTANLILLCFSYRDPYHFLYLYVTCEGLIWLCSVVCVVYFALNNDRLIKKV